MEQTMKQIASFTVNHDKLEKGMYRESGKSFTQVLEQLDPSESYKGTALELSLIHI